jgi:hypothetical protein
VNSFALFMATRESPGAVQPLGSLLELLASEMGSDSTLHLGEAAAGLHVTYPSAKALPSIALDAHHGNDSPFANSESLTSCKAMIRHRPITWLCKGRWGKQVPPARRVGNSILERRQEGI